jgi:hypothetical protein
MMRRQIVVLATVLLASVSDAWAGNITYTIKDYPVCQVDQSGGGTIHVSGQITTDGTLGQYALNDGTITHILNQQLTFTTATGQYQSSEGWGINLWPDTPLFFATSTQLLVRPGDAYGPTVHQQSPVLDLEITWDRSHIVVSYDSYRGHASSTVGLASFAADTTQIVPGSIGASDPWVIATVVPEPSTLALLGIAAIGLLGCVWQYRQMRQVAGVSTTAM